MFKLLFKGMVFAGVAALILALGHIIEWDGRTLSEHVRNQMSRVERTQSFRTAKREFADTIRQTQSSVRKKIEPKAEKLREKSEELTREEREHLRALLKSNR